MVPNDSAKTLTSKKKSICFFRSLLYFHVPKHLESKTWRTSDSKIKIFVLLHPLFLPYHYSSPSPFVSLSCIFKTISLPFTPLAHHPVHLPTSILTPAHCISYITHLCLTFPHPTYSFSSQYIRRFFVQSPLFSFYSITVFSSIFSPFCNR